LTPASSGRSSGPNTTPAGGSGARKRCRRMSRFSMSAPSGRNHSPHALDLGGRRRTQGTVEHVRELLSDPADAFTPVLRCRLIQVIEHALRLCGREVGRVTAPVLYGREPSSEGLHSPPRYPCRASRPPAGHTSSLSELVIRLACARTDRCRSVVGEVSGEFCEPGIPGVAQSGSGRQRVDAHDPPGGVADHLRRERKHLSQFLARRGGPPCSARRTSRPKLGHPRDQRALAG
jgi:hypothetical protein